MADLQAPEGARKKKLIVGRGRSARKGRSCGRGHDGQKSRSGGSLRPGFEGGQMPLYRRTARRGFANFRHKKTFQPISLAEISKRYQDGEVVSLETLREKRLIKGVGTQVKILANGELEKKVTVQGLSLSGRAAEKVKQAGGEVQS